MKKEEIHDLLKAGEKIVVQDFITFGKKSLLRGVSYTISNQSITKSQFDYAKDHYKLSKEPSNLIYPKTYYLSKLS